MSNFKTFKMAMRVKSRRCCFQTFFLHVYTFNKTIQWLLFDLNSKRHKVKQFYKLTKNIYMIRKSDQKKSIAFSNV